MINRIRSFFSALDKDELLAPEFEQKHIAAAALLVEAAHADGEMEGVEEEAIRTVLGRRFQFTDEELDSLLAEGRARAEGSSHLVGFTRIVKSAFDYEQRVEILELLWEVAYADGVLHSYEANLLRRIGGLIYVDDKDRGAAKKRVRRRLGLE